MDETNAILTAILQEMRASKQPLGFGHPPKARYIYANRQYSDCLWYFWNGAKAEHEPIEYRALTGVIEKLEIEEKEFRGKPDYKANLFIRADLTYVIQSGLDTLFARGLLFTLSKLPVEAFRQPITISVEPGDTEQVLFCRVYNPATGQAVFEPYPELVDWNETIRQAISKISSAHSETNNAAYQPQNIEQPTQPEQPPSNASVAYLKVDELKALATQIGFTSAQLKPILKEMGIASNQKIPLDRVEEMRLKINEAIFSAEVEAESSEKQSEVPLSQIPF